MLTRRGLLASATVAGAAPLLGRPARAETPHDVVVAAMQIDDMISLDPGEAFEASGTEIAGNLYERLVVPDAADPNKLVGALAERWDIGADARTYVFHLRGDARFASGAPVTAEDAAFSLQRAVILDKAPGFIVAQFGFTKDNVASGIVATDPRTLTITLPQPQAPTFLLYCLSAGVGSVVEKKAVLAHEKDGDLGNGWLKTNSAGSGPWALRAWHPSESVALDANAAHPHAPQAKRMIIRHVAEPASQVLLLRRGDADIARNLQADQLKSVAGDPALTRVSATKAYTMYLAMNQKDARLARPGVAQAIKWAIDYAGIQANIVPDTWKVHQTFLPEGFPAAIDDTPFHKDAARAKALLAAAGLPDGFEVTLDHNSVSPYSEIAQAVQANLAEIGIKASLLAGEARQVITKTRARGHQLALLVWGSDYFDPNSNAQTFAENTDNGDASTNRTVAWRSAWEIPALTQRTLAAAKETDADKRRAQYVALQREHLETSPFALMLQQVDVATLRRGVSGFHLGALPVLTDYAGIVKS